MDTHVSHPSTATPWSDLVIQDRERHLFRVSRRTFTDEAILEAERRAIFDRCWIYLGHGSEIPNNCDFVTRAVAGRELIFNRDHKGVVHAFLNTCPHRGAMVVREKKGNSLSLPLLLSRLDVQRERPLRVTVRRRQLWHGTLFGLRRSWPGAAPGELSRLLVRQFRQERRVARRLSRRRQGIHRPGGRSLPRPAWRSSARGSSTSSTPTGSCWPRTASTPSTASRCTAPISTT